MRVRIRGRPHTAGLSLRYTTVECLLFAAGAASRDGTARPGGEAGREARGEPSRESRWNSSRESREASWLASALALALAGWARISSLVSGTLDVEQRVVLVLAAGESGREAREAGSSGEPSREPRRKSCGESSREPRGNPRGESSWEAREAGRSCRLALTTSELRGGDGRGSEERDE